LGILWKAYGNYRLLALLRPYLLETFAVREMIEEELVGVEVVFGREELHGIRGYRYMHEL
jgi:hypothetical protein